MWRSFMCYRTVFYARHRQKLWLKRAIFERNYFMSGIMLTAALDALVKNVNGLLVLYIKWIV